MIKQPQDTFNGQYGLLWKKNFANIHGENYEKAQKMLDSEVLKHCSKRVPFDTGMLDKSGILNTVIGSGRIVYKTPYARKLYYHPEYNFQGAPMRGGMWFERVKADMGRHLLRMAMRMASGGGE